ncbi:MAG: hypothetical protein WBO04_14385 [Steroidobacteraceae bacterium]
MTRRGQSVAFAALPVVAQLLFGVMSGGVMAHDGAQHCGGCPGGDSSNMSHDMGSNGSMLSADHGGTHCSHNGSTDTGSSGCGAGCAMPGSGHCGSHANSALIVTSLITPVVQIRSFGVDARSVDLPDSPLFDFLRPPTRA